MPSGPTSTGGQCLREHCCANSRSIRRKLLVLKIKAEMPPRICKSKLTFQLLDLIWARRGVCGLSCEWKHRISRRETLDLAAFPPGGSEPSSGGQILSGGARGRHNRGSQRSTTQGFSAGRGRKRDCSSGHGSGRSCWKVLLAPAGHQACAPSGKLSPEPGLVFRSPTTSRTTSTRGRRPGEDLAWCKLGIPCQLSPTALTCREIVEILSWTSKSWLC